MSLFDVNFRQVAIISAFTVFSYIVLVILYRLTFHPLARYPGPLLGRITDFYGVYHGVLADSHVNALRNHEKYGPIVRFGPNKLSFNTNTALKAIYTSKNIRKSDFYTVLWPTKTPASANTFSVIDRDIHARKRRVMSHAFSDSSIKSMEGYMLNNIRIFSSLISSGSSSAADETESKSSGGWSTAKNMATHCTYLTFDVLGDLCFGKTFGLLTSPKNRGIPEMMLRGSHASRIMGPMPLLYKYNIEKTLLSNMAQGMNNYRSFGAAAAEERAQLGKEGNDERKDFLYYLLNAKDAETGSGYGPVELWTESNLLIAAGSDTSSTTLSATFHFLLHNPSMLRRLEEEVRATFADVEDIVSGPKLNSCTYLRAVLDETMRLAPPVPGFLSRQVVGEGTEIDGEVVPPGTIVGVQAYAIHRNSEYFSSPTEFKPERWIADEKESSIESVALANSAFCPFSLGSRGCIGRGMAYVEMMNVIARTVWTFEMRLEDGKIGREGTDYPLRDHFIAGKDGPMVEFRPCQVRV